MEQATRQVKLLVYLHLVVGWLTIITPLVLVPYALSHPSLFGDSQDYPGLTGGPPILYGVGELISTVVGAMFTLLGLFLGSLTCLAGKNLRLGFNLWFIRSMAVLNLVNVPFGTALGIFTLIAMTKPANRAHFYRQPRSWGGPVG